MQCIGLYSVITVYIKKGADADTMRFHLLLIVGLWNARHKLRILGDCFLPSNSTCILKAEPGKLGIKRREAGTLFISLPFVLLFKLAFMT